MKKIENLYQIVESGINGSTEKQLSVVMAITEAEARKLIASSSFAEYVSLIEATTQGTVGTTGTSDTKDSLPFNSMGRVDINKLKPGHAVGAKINGQDLVYKVKNVIGNDIEVDDGKGSTLKIPRDQALGPNDSKALSDFFSTEQPSTTPNLDKVASVAKGVAGAINTGASKFMQGMRSTLKNSVDPEEDEELSRMLELAGVKETSSAGATSAGAIASGPSIIGNTNAAHRPTVQLRSRLRKQRNKKKD